MENFNPKQAKQLNNLLSEMPEKLAKTGEMDNTRKKVADLLAETKTSLDALMTSKEMDEQKIKWWMEQAKRLPILKKYNENKQ